MLINKYKPGSLKEIFGHNSQIQELKKNILLKKPVLIYGGTGIGKTATVYALCNDLDYEILEVNSSDLRNKEQIDTIVKNNLQQKSLFQKEKLVLIDEVDGINAKDRGGLQELIKLFEDAKYPIVLIANNPWDSKFKTLRKNCKLIEFKKLDKELVFNKRKVNFNLFNNLDEDLNEIMLWLEENIPKEYYDEELNKAFDFLSKADVYKGRILRRQYYRFLVYQNLLMQAGTSLAKKKENDKVTSYQRTSRILKIWIYNIKNAKRKEFVKNLAPELHLSSKKLNQELRYMNFLKY